MQLSLFLLLLATMVSVFSEREDALMIRVVYSTHISASS
jgi:hypothetical protein